MLTSPWNNSYSPKLSFELHIPYKHYTQILVLQPEKPLHTNLERFHSCMHWHTVNKTRYGTVSGTIMAIPPIFCVNGTAVPPFMLSFECYNQNTLKWHPEVNAI